MVTIKKQYYNIKFPFTFDNDRKHFIDLNETLEEGVASRIVHVILTPKRSRLRKPDFGTDLIKYIYEPNDSITWDGVREEITTSISKYVSNVEVKDVQIIQKEGEEHTFFIKLKYVTIKGNKKENNELIIKV